jgi:polysaccharide export outer membrane protein
MKTSRRHDALRALALLATISAAALLYACAAQPVAPPAAAPSSAAAGAPPAAAPYRLSAGDELLIKFFYTPELNEQQIIRPDGTISLPLVGEIHAAGLSPRELHDRLVDAYSSKYLKSGSTEIQVTVRALNSVRFFVGGEVGQAGALPLIGTTTVSRAIMQAQGFKPTAYTQQVLLIHATEDGHADVHQVNVESVLRAGGVDPVVTSQDIVFVPRSPIARVDLFVDQYMRSLLPFTMGVNYNYNNGVRVY